MRTIFLFFKFQEPNYNFFFFFLICKTKIELSHFRHQKKKIPIIYPSFSPILFNNNCTFQQRKGPNGPNPINAPSTIHECYNLQDHPNKTKLQLAVTSTPNIKGKTYIITFFFFEKHIITYVSIRSHNYLYICTPPSV